MTPRAEAHAIVLGAGIAGLFTARVLSEFYGRVTVLDRDDLAGAPHEPRRGVPQSGHAHDFLARGHQISEELFPGLGDELAAAGAHAGDIAGAMRWIVGGHPLRKPVAGLGTVTASRPFREFHLRRRVRALPGVTVHGDRDVTGFTTAGDGDAVVGVTVTRRDGTGAEHLPADLVVDTTGRGSRTPVRLEELGYGRVEETRLKVDIGYVTRYVRTPPGAFAGDISVNIVASADSPRGGACQRVDGERTVVTLYGLLGDHPPLDHDGFLAFAKSLAAPDIHEILEVSEPLSEPRRYRFPAGLRRHYERLARFPRGLLVLGDAVCSLNPRYGQGMTLAALQTTVLRDRLRAADGAQPDPAEFFAQLTEQVVGPVWDMTVLSDLSIPGVEGERPPELMQVLELVGRTQAAATLDDELAVACLKVFGLVDPPAALLGPEIQERVAATL
ncbi:FAD-dependent oxidoreductase [Streptomyces sp. NPDC003247]|uniref:FAD-dependent oxidoreductase n=1 Tax=Streptomyces sp. NPDC003247 TaxID=3364677 RepID=UPI00368B1200